MLEDTPGQEPITAPDGDSAETPAGAAPADPPAAKKAAAKKAPAKKATTKKATTAKAPAKKAPAKKAPAAKAPAKKSAAAKATAKKASAPSAVSEPEQAPAASPDPSAEPVAEIAATAPPTVKVTTRRRTTKKVAATPPAAETPAADSPSATAGATAPETSGSGGGEDAASAGTALLFQPPDAAKAPARKPRKARADAPAAPAQDSGEPSAAPAADDASTEDHDQTHRDEGEDSDEGGGRRRRRRGGRRRRKSGGDADGGEEQSADGGDTESGDGSSTSASQAKASKETGKSSGKNSGRGPGKGSGQDSGKDSDDDSDSDGEGTSSRRRRRRRRSGEDGGDGGDDPQNTVTRVRQQRSAEDQITTLSGSTRLEAKKQRRREGREAGRRRAPIVSEAEFLARRESVDRMMAIRQREDLTQIAVLEDKVLVEHYVARESQTSLIGNVYLGRVQNVLPSMEAAFIDIGKGRNAVLYAGEVNWSALGHKEGQPRKIEAVLSSGQPVLVQVTKDPVGHKGARLTSQISLAGRFLVYVPDGTNSGISRKLPDTERNRLKTLLKEIVPESAGVIVRTAAEGASEEELTHDVERLTTRWTDIEKRSKGSAPQLLYGEPDLTLKVVRDLFTEDFSQLIIQGDDAWDTVQAYVNQVAPDLEERLERHDGSATDIFAAYRVDEQIAKGLDRKVWLPSGGSLIIDRTEAMTVVDVNTGKFTGSGGNLEETVTKNNLEAAEEMVRQLRLRDIGGIIVIDFIDMVLESNRDLVLRRLVECLGRDRTRHQVAEVTSLGLVQMTRKRIGTGLLEAFSESCPHCAGRGLLVTEAPVEPRKGDDEPRKARRSRGGRGRSGDGNDDEGSRGGDQDQSNGQRNGQGSRQGSRGGDTPAKSGASPKDVAAMARVAEAKAQDGAAAESATEPSREVDEPVEAVALVDTDTAETAETVETGAPADAEAPAAPVEAAPSDPGTAQPDEPAPTLSTEPTAEQPEQPGQAEPAGATTGVVTRTRRRSARRPAGPPSGAAATPSEGGSPAGALGSVGSPPQSGAVEPGTAEAEPAATPVVEHVPVKKRGSRKR